MTARRALSGLRAPVTGIAVDGDRAVVRTGPFLLVASADGRVVRRLVVRGSAPDRTSLAGPFAAIAPLDRWEPTQVWNVETGAHVRDLHLREPIADVAIARDGTVWLACTAGGRIVRVGPGEPETVWESGAQRVTLAIDHARGRVVVATESALVGIDAHSLEHVESTRPPSAEPTAIAAHDGLVLVADLTRVHVVRAGRPVLSVPLRAPGSVSLSLAGDRAAAIGHRGATLFSVEDGAEIGRFPAGAGHAGVLFGDGSALLLASGDGRISWWPSSRARGRRLAAHTGAVEALARAPGGLVSGGRDGLVVRWSDAGTPVDRWEIGEPVNVVAIGGGGALAGGDTGQIHQRGAEPWGTVAGPIYALDVVTPRGVGAAVVVAGSSDGRLHLGALGEGPSASPEVHRRPVLALRGSPDGTRIASGGRDGVLAVTTIAGHPVWRAELDAAVRCVAWSERGERLAAGTEDGRVHLWDATGVALETARVGRAWVTALAFAPGDAALLAGTRDGALHRLAGEPLRPEPSGARRAHPVRALVPLGGGLVAVAGTGAHVELEAIEPAQPLTTLDVPAASVSALAWSLDGAMLYAARCRQLVAWRPDGSRALDVEAPLAVWTLAAHRDGGVLVGGCHHDVHRLSPERASLRRHLTTGDAGGALAVGVSREGRVAFTVSGPGGRVRLWDLETRKEIRRGELQPGTCKTVLFHTHDLAAWSPAREVFAVGAPGGAVLVADAEGGAREIHPHDDDAVVVAVAFSPDGALLVSGADDGSLVATDLVTDDVRWRRERAHGEGVFRPPGVTSIGIGTSGLLASAGGDDVRLWDLADGSPRGCIEGWVTPPRKLAWQPGGDLLAVGAGTLEAEGAITLIDAGACAAIGPR